MRGIRNLTSVVFIAVLASSARPAVSQPAPMLSRVFAVSPVSPVVLEVELSEGDLQIVYARDGQVTVTTMQGSGAGQTNQNAAASTLEAEQDGSHLKLLSRHVAGREEGLGRISCRVDVPYRTEVHAVVGEGKLTVTGVMGPVSAVTHRGDIKVSYVPRAVSAHADTGNLDLEVIGEHAEAKTGVGNITCLRAPQGVEAATDDGNIHLAVVGASIATVANGNGLIEIGGARGNLAASTAGGDLRVKAVPHDEWKLSSASGTVRVDLPRAFGFDIDLSTGSGAVEIDREDIQKDGTDPRHLRQSANGGGNKIQIHTDSGKIVLTNET